ncbi:T9SS type A sorting domain-containing protein [Chryseobacterium sp. JUb7]|uniref:T9SS type A sorting domain-containing protein n=1 Tax=Chryseobacterium sp. JUb7 TaxID=2940599 RepID=UPI0038D48D11|nr:hypothetical protein [Chryseobacterium sp. JUb7]
MNFNNPFSNELNIKTNKKINRIDIFDDSGRLILTEKSKTDINTSSLHKGIYIIKITADSNEIISRKAIKN